MGQHDPYIKFHKNCSGQIQSNSCTFTVQCRRSEYWSWGFSQAFQIADFISSYFDSRFLEPILCYCTESFLRCEGYDDWVPLTIQMEALVWQVLKPARSGNSLVVDHGKPQDHTHIIQNVQHVNMSCEKNPGCLGGIPDYTTPLHSLIGFTNSPINQAA